MGRRTAPGDRGRRRHRLGGACRAAGGVRPAPRDAPVRDILEELPRLLGRPELEAYQAIFRWSTTPADLPDVGTWLPVDDPVIPEWLRPFGGSALVVLDDGVYVAGVGLKRHDEAGWEIAVGPSRPPGARAWPAGWWPRQPGRCLPEAPCRRTSTIRTTSPPRTSRMLLASRTSGGPPSAPGSPPPPTPADPRDALHPSKRRSSTGQNGHIDRRHNDSTGEAGRRGGWLFTGTSQVRRGARTAWERRM